MNNIRDAESLRKCAHEPCQCLVPVTQEYCSAYCSNADDVENADLRCDCGHLDCDQLAASFIKAHQFSAACNQGRGMAGSSQVIERQCYGRGSFRQVREFARKSGPSD